MLGSIPFALIIGKLVKGIDIREHGSRNMGATNALRVLGIKWGIIVFALDMLKAGLIIGLFRFNIIPYSEYDLVHPLVYGVCAILGHLFSGFRQISWGQRSGLYCGNHFGLSAAAFFHQSLSFHHHRCHNQICFARFLISLLPV